MMEEKKTEKKPVGEKSEGVSPKKANEELKKQLEEAKKQAEEYKDKWIRNVAEFDNYKKRNAKLEIEARNDGKTEVILKVLPVGDNLDIALSMDLDEKTMEGIKLIKRKFEDTLKGVEVTEINPIGEPFDPEIAEAVMQVPAGEGEEPDTVKQVFEKGYRMKDKIIRYAKVSVIK